MQDVVYSTRRDHQSWVDSAADNPAKRVPCSLVEPVQEIIETVFDHVCCCTVVEPVTHANYRRQLMMPMHYNMCAYTRLVTCVSTYHGSNSWMMLSNRMTANSRAENPDTHARKRMANVMRLFHPAGLVSNVFILTSGFAAKKLTHMERDRSLEQI